MRMVRYINAHCHIDGCRNFVFGTDGIVGAVCNSTQMSNWDAVVKFAAEKPAVRACIGIHPWYVNTATAGWDAQMNKMLRENPALMVGEIGIDKTHPDFSRQLEIFTRQMEIAAENNRVAHIHCVGAWDILQNVFAEMGTHMPRVVMHAFVATPEIVRAIARKYDAYFSFSDAVMDSRRTRLHRAVATVGVGRILIETDDAQMEILPKISECVANIRRTPHDEMARILYENTMCMLGK